ncbi:hypothetical protein LTR51_005235 [Lithohypha guttulata]|nr:hypothetical protein LTR51_005235 [Lithohypha guttulata]
MGNSAGGIHLSTYLFTPDFAVSRSKVMTSDSEASVVLRGVIFLQGDPSRDQVLQEYYGDEVDSRAPQGLLKAAMLQDPDAVLPNVTAMLLNGSLDPDDEIMDPRDEFLYEWKLLDERSRERLTVAMMDGHNHISPALSLGTNIEMEEAWGYQVGEFVDSLRS